MRKTIEFMRETEHKLTRQVKDMEKQIEKLNVLK